MFSMIELLMQMQYNMPVCRGLFYELSRRLDISITSLLKLVHELKERGIIRRVGAVLNYRARGLEAALVGLQVPETEIENVSQHVNSLGGVSHNFLREHRYNMWFVIKRSSIEEIVRIVRSLVERYRIHNYVVLRSVKTYRLDVRFNLYRGISEAKILREPDTVPKLDEVTKLSVNILRELVDVPLVEDPLGVIAERHGIDPDVLIGEVQKLVRLRVLRDFYAVLNQEKIGFKVNAMIVVKDADVDRVLNLKEPTHIVYREYVDGTERFGEGLYLMVHAVSRDVIVRFLKEKLRNVEYQVLYSVKNLLPTMPHDVEYSPSLVGP